MTSTDSTTRPEAPASTSRSTRQRLGLLAVLVVAVALLVLAVTRPGTGSDDPAPDQAAPAADQGASPEGPAAGVVEPEQQQVPDMARRDAQDPLAAGPVDAPVALVVYSDYQCPFCALWSEQTLPTMLERAEAGDLRIEWRDVNVYGADSERASRAAYAAGLQDRFWEYHERLFPEGEKRTPAQLSEEALLTIASELGLDTARFTADMASEEVAAAVQANADEGASIGAFSTPSFLLGSTPIVGAQPTEVFVGTLEEELAKAGA